MHYRYALVSFTKSMYLRVHMCQGRGKADEGWSGSATDSANLTVSDRSLDLRWSDVLGAGGLPGMC